MVFHRRTEDKWEVYSNGGLIGKGSDERPNNTTFHCLMEKNDNPLQYSCLENPMDRGAWQATVHRVARVGHDLVTKLPLPVPLDFTGGSVVRSVPVKQGRRVPSLGQEDPLEKQMATHSSIFAWRTPWTEEPGRLQSTGLHRVGCD